MYMYIHKALLQKFFSWSKGREPYDAHDHKKYSVSQIFVIMMNESIFAGVDTVTGLLISVSNILINDID